MRADVKELRAQVETLSRTVAGLAEDVSDARAYAKNLPAVQSPQTGGEGMQWWGGWVDARLDARLDMCFEEYSEGSRPRLGEKVRDICEEFGRAIDAIKRDHELSRREFGVLRDEVRLTQAQGFARQRGEGAARGAQGPGKSRLGSAGRPRRRDCRTRHSQG